MKWLQEADTEESESEESDEDVEIEYDDRAQVTPLKPKMTVPVKKAHADDEEGEEFDIDAI